MQACESMSNSLIDDESLRWTANFVSTHNGDGQFSSTLEKDYNHIRTAPLRVATRFFILVATNTCGRSVMI